MDIVVRYLSNHAMDCSLLYIALLVGVMAPVVDAQDSFPAPSKDFDVIIRNGTVYDGSGNEGRRADVALRGDRIAGVGDFKSAAAKVTIDARGLAVAPGFINMLSWSTESLIADGRSQSEIRQGVTTEIMGEGESMGPVNDRVREKMLREQKDIHYEIKWTTLAEYLRYLEDARHFLQRRLLYRRDHDSRERHRLRRQGRPRRDSSRKCARSSGRKWKPARSVSARSLIYPPAFYAKTPELIELCKVAAQYQGKYISHMRSEGNQLLEALDELIRISREAKIPAEIYHIKAAGESNWAKLDTLLARIEAAQKEGLKITADMYTYTAAGTGLDACLPPWTEDGGYPALFKRLRDPGDAQEDRGGSAKRRATTGRIFISRRARPTRFCSSVSSRKN